MKIFLLIVTIFVSSFLFAQEKKTEFDGHTWVAPYHFPVPKDWTIERFLLPPFFAPRITYKGVEDIRFMPGWGNVKSDEYWSYLFLWYLDDKPTFDRTKLENDLKFYYEGLIRINSDSSKAASESPIPVITSLEALPRESTSYSGSVQMRDFMTRKPITLNCKVYLFSCPEGDKTIVIFELSPQPFKHPVWVGLDQVRRDFVCEKK